LKVFVNGIAFDKLSAQEAAEKVIHLLKNGRSGYVVTPNVEIMASARDTELFDVLSGADIVLCDGIGVSAMSLMRGKLLRRATGIDLAQHLLKMCQDEGVSVFLYGAKGNIAERAKKNLETIYPRLSIVGTCNGYLSEDLAGSMIRDSGAKVVFVCTSSPKQEFFAREAARASSGVFYLALGGVLDIFSGEKKRAPKLLQKLGLEWSYRFVCEPYRIKRFIKNVFGIKSLPNNR